MLASPVDPSKIVAQLPSRRFQPLVFGVGAWTDNLHFAYDLIASLRPGCLVELGTDRGESYFAFCQSVLENETGTRCYAVDTWLGDSHAGNYDETTFADVAAHNRAHYANFSTLCRSSFDEALTHFAPASIDLLHLDGLHTEEAIRHDLGNWLPQIAPGGILLLHDVSVRMRDFGVWKVWEELKTKGRSYTFAEGPGLGVWQKTPATTLADPLEILLDGASETATQLREYYLERAGELQRRIAEQWRDGSIRQTMAARQTIIKVYYSRDGIYREEHSLLARIGHETWKDVSLPLPLSAGSTSLRVDLFSALTVIDLSLICVTSGEEDVFRADAPGAFEDIKIAGDAERLPHPDHFRLKMTGANAQLYLPTQPNLPNESGVRANLRLKVSADLQTPTPDR